MAAVKYDQPFNWGVDQPFAEFRNANLASAVGICICEWKNEATICSLAVSAKENDQSIYGVKLACSSDDC
jgi:hypothetical protein